MDNPNQKTQSIAQGNIPGKEGTQHVEIETQVGKDNPTTPLQSDDENENPKLNNSEEPLKKGNLESDTTSTNQAINGLQRRNVTQVWANSGCNATKSAAALIMVVSVVLLIIATLCLSNAFPAPLLGGKIGCMATVIGGTIVLVSGGVVLFVHLRQKQTGI